MWKLTFKKQIVLGILLIITGNILAFVFRKGIFSNIAWILYGLVGIINPVYPEWYQCNEKKARLGARIAGVVCVTIGLITRFVV